MDASTSHHFDIRGGQEIVGRTRAWASSVAGSLGADAQAMADIALAVSEAVTNVVRYAYDDDQECHITLSAERIDERVVVRLRDYGHKFDPAGVPPPSMEGEPSVGGYGIFLMQRVMDEVQYRTDHAVGTELILVRRCHTAAR